MENVLYIYGTTPTTFTGMELATPHRAVVAVVLDEQDNVVATGAAICSQDRPKGGPKPDYFNKKVGRCIALQRATLGRPQYAVQTLRNFQADARGDKLVFTDDGVPFIKKD